MIGGKCENCDAPVIKMPNTNEWKHQYSCHDIDCNYPEIEIPKHFKEYVRQQIAAELDRLGLLI